MTEERITYLKNMRIMTKELILVEDSVTDIPARVKKIDPGYFIMFNPMSQRFEVHHEEQDITFCLSLPFEELDQRTLDEIHRTKIENGKKIMDGMTSRNDYIERDMQRKRSDAISYHATEIHKYCIAHESVEKLDPGAFKTRFV